MSAKLPPHFIDLVQDCLLKSFWKKIALRRFLRRCHISENFLAGCSDDELKRDWLDRLFPILEKTERGHAIIQQMAIALADQSSFPDLEKWEDSTKKIAEAKASVKLLKEYLEQKREEKETQADIKRRRELGEESRQRQIRSKSNLTELKDRLDKLSLQLGTRQAGYDFQDWFYDAMNYSEIDNRRPYTTPEGRQIDGSITIDGTTYLVELKFSGTPADAPDIDSIATKVRNNHQCTMGILVAISSFTSVAKTQASVAGSSLLLLDHGHLYMALCNVNDFATIVRRVRRHASQEGEAYLPVERFGG
jgi:hypothetical protein